MKAINYRCFCLLFVVSIASVAFNSCRKDNNGNEKKDTAYDGGVIINGVKWATRNIDAPGTFAAKPENAGMFYQWNRKKGWPAIGGATSWNSTDPKGDYWEQSNDPSPVGWRIPTLSEIQTLFNREKVANEWTAINGINGKKFTDLNSGDTLFFPACGYRFFSNGMIFGAGSNGFYWSNTVHESHTDVVYYLNLVGSDASTTFGSGRTDGYNLRCVAK
jgi:uncharacterized protein (TIGR02145 family)